MHYVMFNIFSMVQITGKILYLFVVITFFSITSNALIKCFHKINLISNNLSSNLIVQKLKSIEIEDFNESNEAWLKTLEERSHSAVKGSFQFKNSDLSNLAGYLREEHLNLFPEFQRSFVWDEAKSSRLIATVIENRMVPAVVIHKSNDKLEVVDGKQRLCALLAFMMAKTDRQLLEKLKIPVEKFEYLSGLQEEYEYLNGKSFADLPKKTQFNYKLFTISYAEIPENIPDDTVFNIFSDINSGGVEMKAQQIRRASYFGEYIKKLDELSLYDKFKKAFSHYTYCDKSDSYITKIKNEKEALLVESDKEAILRAIALRKLYAEYKAPMKLFINKELKRVNELIKESQIIELNKIEEEFKEVIDIAWAIFDEHAFQDWKYDKKNDIWEWDITFSQIDFDIIYCVLSELQSENNKRKKLDYIKVKDYIVKEWKNIKQDPKKFVMTKNNFINRRDIFKNKIKECFNQILIIKDSKRNFNNRDELKKILYQKQNGICMLCFQSISEIRLSIESDYCDIDHIIPHTHGGLTEIHNAQLVHASCNRSKGSKILSLED